jgi:hypothetical protein
MSALPPKLGKPTPSTSRVKVPRRHHIPASQLPALHHFVNGNATQHFSRSFFAPPLGTPDSAPKQQAPVISTATLRQEAAFLPPAVPLRVDEAPRKLPKEQRPPPASHEPGRITAVTELPVCLMKGRELPTKWPHRCFWDHHEFDTPPVGLPVGYDAKRKAFLTFGIFCCYNCAAAFSAESIGHILNQKARVLLSQLLRAIAKAHGEQVTVATLGCRPSPHWSTLSAYGGYMDIVEFRRAIEDRRLGLHVFPPWLKLVPIGYLMYTEDRTQPLPGEFSANYTVIPDDSPLPSSFNEGGAHSQADPHQKKRLLSSSGATVASSTLKEKKTKLQTPHGQMEQSQMFTQWNWQALQRRSDAEVAMSALDEQAKQAEAKPLLFKRNVLTGRREAAAQPTDAEIVRKAATLRANALPSLRVDPRQPNIAMQLSRASCSVDLPPAMTAAKKRTYKPSPAKPTLTQPTSPDETKVLSLDPPSSPPSNSSSNQPNSPTSSQPNVQPASPPSSPLSSSRKKPRISAK